MTLEMERLIESFVREYPGQWQRVIHEWSAPGADTAWLTYSANYLLRTAGLHWALDPFSLFTRVGHDEQPDFLGDLAALDLVVLSHAHNDHLDLNLLKAIESLPIPWIVPEFMLEQVCTVVNLPAERLIVPEPGRTFRIGELALTPFEGLHFNRGAGVPEMGYLAAFNGKRWLFPGDTRSYEPQRLPDFQPLDGLVAHLWLGKGAALLDPPPLLEEFLTFCTWQNPSRIALTHLFELGRSAEEMWTFEHAKSVCAELLRDYPDLSVDIARVGEKFAL